MRSGMWGSSLTLVGRVFYKTDTIKQHCLSFCEEFRFQNQTTWIQILSCTADEMFKCEQ